VQTGNWYTCWFSFASFANSAFFVTEITLRDKRYRLTAVERDAEWIARAIDATSGDPFGIECAGTTEGEAIARLTRWLRWQHEHAAALAALQQAERAYHRTVAGTAFANPTEGPSAIEIQKESLAAVEAARRRLDELRASKPE
jgi:hypothetical protein